MIPDHKKILRAVSLELRHTLEGTYDERGDFHPGDLEDRLNALGVWRDRPAKSLSQLGHLPDEDKEARRVVDAYLAFRAEAGVGQVEAVAEFVRESAYTWANRLLCLRCMEARGIIDEVVLQKEVYGRRSMVHNRLGRQDPALLATPDEGLFAVLSREFELRARELPGLFNPKAPAIALHPSLAALKKCIGLLSGTEKAGSNGTATDAVFAAPDALGWAYQYWNAEEKDRVFEKVRTERGAKIEGADIIPATQLYTEPYMVKFLVQNSLGALWMGMHPDSALADGWEYYVRDADRAPVEQKRVQAITFLDPACGSGHFHLEAFDLLYAMYAEEGELSEPESICAAILNHNLYGVDIDERAVQIAQAALWMKAKEIAWDLAPEALTGFHHHFVATNIRLPRGKDHLEAFLRKYPEDLPLRPALETVFEGLENAHELGSLLQLEEPVEKELRFLRGKQEEAQQEGFQSALFAKMDKPRQGKLPVGIESYAAWKDKVLSQLRSDFEEEGEAANLVQAFFGRSAGKGLALFDILARRYAVVTANPPWMGSKNMGITVSRYLSKHFGVAKRDTYSSFILRAQQLVEDQCYTAMITLHSWLFLSSFSELRIDQAGKGLLKESRVESLVHLGRHAFSEADPPGDPVMFVFRSMEANDEHRLFSVRLNRSRPSHEQAELLEKCVAGESKDLVSRLHQYSFLSIPDSPIVYWANPELVHWLQYGARLDSIADVKSGVVTGNNDRYLRFHWEADSRHNTGHYAKGGGYGRWAGFEYLTVNWEQAFPGIKETKVGRTKDPSYFGECGWTYTLISRGSLSVRYLSEESKYDNISLSIFPHQSSNFYRLGALLMSRAVSYFLRCLSPSWSFNAYYVRAIPLPIHVVPETLEESGRLATRLKQSINRENLIEMAFHGYVTDRGNSLTERFRNATDRVNQNLALLHTLEGYNETIVNGYYQISSSAVDALIEETGLPSGWYPLIQDYDTLPSSSTLSQLPNLHLDSFSDHVRKPLSHQELAILKDSLRTLYEAGTAANSEELNSFESDETEESLDTHRPIPTDSFLENLSTHLQTHPISIFWLLKEGIEQAGWRCLPEETRYAEDLFTVTVLRLLGHRWLKQIEREEPVPVWADKDGIIPISSGGHGEATLYDRIREQIAGEFPNGNTNSIEREFAEIVGEPLTEWLSRSFYARHISQFKKRPIAWQLETTTSGRGRGNPAFSCLIYYHHLDADLLPKIRSQYIRDLRRGYETEQRTLRQMSSRTADQDARLLQLDAWLDELSVFDEKLEQVSVSGFGDTPVLQAQLRQYAIDDAMQSLKVGWLRRLADVVAGGPLQDWQLHAAKTDIHPELGDWIAAAMDPLHHHCASVGAKSPQAGKLRSDPDARALAAVIGTQAAQMVQQAISLACDAWFDDLDSHALQPALDEINDLKAQVTEQEEKLNDLVGAHETRARYDVEQAVKSLKARIKKLTQARNEQRQKAKELREHIEGWTYPEAAGWTEWLGTQPLFDQFASSDGQKSPPHTIADFVAQESRYDPDINDGVRVNIAPLQKAGLLAADVLAAKDVDKAIADRADWRADERRWCREGKLPRPGWWVVSDSGASK